MIVREFCSRCGRQIQGIGWNKGPMNNCPHCGVFLQGLQDRHIRELGSNIRWLIILGFITGPLCIVLWAQAYMLHERKKVAILPSGCEAAPQSQWSTNVLVANCVGLGLGSVVFCLSLSSLYGFFLRGVDKSQPGHLPNGFLGLALGSGVSIYCIRNIVRAWRARR
jgi:hypothetical protein